MVSIEEVRTQVAKIQAGNKNLIVVIDPYHQTLENPLPKIPKNHHRLVGSIGLEEFVAGLDQSGKHFNMQIILGVPPEFSRVGNSKYDGNEYDGDAFDPDYSYNFAQLAIKASNRTITDQASNRPPRLIVAYTGIVPNTNLDKSVHGTGWAVPLDGKLAIDRAYVVSYDPKNFRREGATTMVDITKILTGETLKPVAQGILGRAFHGIVSKLQMK